MELLLKQYFGYDTFRPLQSEIIQNVLQKNDSLVLMPTGGGKSLCYQIPALQFAGLTLVISPLISLMKDQVDNLKANGVQAEFINSTLSHQEIEQIKDSIKEKKVKLLYIAPERLALEDFKIFLLSQQISLIAIDEAHCISEWGHDFRKDYRNLTFLKKFFPNVPIIALTATATLKVREDILKQLSLVNSKIFISSFDRKNLNLMVMPKKDTFGKILSLLKKNKDEPAIIYCFSRDDTEKITQKLREAGLKALPYHAGLSSELRKKNQELFIQDKVNIIAATIAFGMGIDKPDIRVVIHHTFSKSIEGYYQEIGRAGRDGLTSDCVLFYTRGDVRKHKFFLDKV
ncbi:ATP-dependent DNA helicase RecQ, partial [Candidatus Woesearchaeota archaeon]|nr:ATP-dependent DNA helicase RecQ [Candidatus Woesearchaeota archaeon]